MENKNHGFEIEKLKGSFTNILQVIDEISGVKQTANITLQKLKDAYGTLISENHEKVFLFCLDSFYFQYKSFQLELENLEKGFSFLNNRMYCDYYKLYKMIINTIKEQKQEFSTEAELRNYMPYKDLEPFQEYRIEDIKDIHQNILHNYLNINIFWPALTVPYNDIVNTFLVNDNILYATTFMRRFHSHGYMYML